MRFSLRKTLANRLRLMACAGGILTMTSALNASPNASSLRQRLHKLQVLKSVLYVAAHPDDENTYLLAWLANEQLANTSYVSLTRGDGGQNLMGEDLSEKLGVLRSQELLSARRVDGAEQYFTRARDFGYSKNSEETFTKWERDALTQDLAMLIRTIQPDVIVGRFNQWHAYPYPTHGHHTAAGILSIDAFNAAADPAYDLDGLAPFQSSGVWWDVYPHTKPVPSSEESVVIHQQISGYNPLLGKTYAQIAAQSRSQHGTQGFGIAAEWGTRVVSLELLAGEGNADGLFAGIDTSWSRLEGGSAVGDLLKSAEEQFVDTRPWEIVPLLLDARAAMLVLPESRWTSQKRKELDQLVLDCLGFEARANSPQPYALTGGRVQATLSAVNQSPLPVAIKGYAVSAFSAPLWPGRFPTAESKAVANLPQGEPWNAELDIAVPTGASISQPFWLAEGDDPGLFTIKNPALRNLAAQPPAFAVTLNVQIGDAVIQTQTPVEHFWVAPEFGERRVPLALIPAVTLGFADDQLFFADSASRVAKIVVDNHGVQTSGELLLNAPEGWRIEPASYVVSTLAEGEVAEFEFVVTPPAQAESVDLTAHFKTSSGFYNRGFELLEYPHLDPQVLLPLAELRAIRVDLEWPVGEVAYIPGSGDRLPDALRIAGKDVTVLDPADITGSDALSGYRAVILGIRAFNVWPDSETIKAALIDYAEAGGTVVVQYNTTANLSGLPAPYNFEITRDRITDENAPVVITAPEHPALLSPNVIAQADFDDWVQERGLYFPQGWGSEWQSILRSSDPNEEALDGGILISAVGQGYWVNTSLSFFRQLPAGVPGAYRLFANLIALGEAEDVRN